MALPHPAHSQRERVWVRESCATAGPLPILGMAFPSWRTPRLRVASSLQKFFVKFCTQRRNEFWRIASVAILLLRLPLCLLAQPASPPSISFIPDQGVFPNSTSRPIAFVVGDAQTPAQQLSVSGGSANTNLVSNSGIVFGGSGSNRTATIIPSLNQTGTTTITITVTDQDGGAGR